MPRCRDSEEKREVNRVLSVPTALSTTSPHPAPQPSNRLAASWAVEGAAATVHRVPPKAGWAPPLGPAWGTLLTAGAAARPAAGVASGCWSGSSGPGRTQSHASPLL